MRHKSGGAPPLGSRRYKDRKTSFKQLAASDERLDVSTSDASLDDIVRARASLVGSDRLTRLLSSSNTSEPAIDEAGEEAEAEAAVAHSGLGHEANRNLERIQTNLGLRSNRGVWDTEELGEGGFQFYSNTPRQSEHGSDGALGGMSPASSAGSGFGITIKLDDVKVVTMDGEHREYVRQDSNASSASEGVRIPGLEVFGELGYSEEESGTAVLSLQQLASHAAAERAYAMAVRSVMLAWEKPAESLVQRLQLADTLRGVFDKDKVEHLKALRRAMHENGRAADELAARIASLEEGVVEDFIEEEAAEAWGKDELAELRRMLMTQLALPVFNAMLEVAVIKGMDLKSKASTRRLACLTPHVVTDHLVVIDMLQQPLSVTSPRPPAPPAPIRTDLARGSSPTWNIKASPIFLQHSLSTMRMQVCTSGFFDDQQSREGRAVASALPLMSALPMDSFPTLGQHTVGWCRIGLVRENGDPETGYLLPVERTVPILRKSRGAFGGCMSPQNDFPPLRVEEDEEKNTNKKGRKGWTEMGQVQIVIRYVPETREASPSSAEIRAACKGALQPVTRHSSVLSPSVAADVERRVAMASERGTNDPPTPMPADDAANYYGVLMMKLWECWDKHNGPALQNGHTFLLPGQSNSGTSVKTVGTRKSLSKAAAKGSWSQRHNGEAPTLQLEANKNENVVDALAKYCPGEPWSSVLEATAKLYRIRRAWHDLLMVKRLLLSWRLEPDYLEALLLFWKPIVEVARNGQCTRRESMLHVGCTQSIVRHCIRAIEYYHVAFGERRGLHDTVMGLRRLLELTCLAIRYDTQVEALVEPLKIHISRAVSRRVKQALPRGPMKRDVYLASLRDAIELATSALRRDMELADAFPASLDLPHFTARLRYKKLSDHMRHFFTGPGVVAYDHLVMDVQDKLYELHQLMIDAGLSVHSLAGEAASSSHIRLLNMDKMFGRSLLKWIRDIGLNMKEWVDNAVKVDRSAEWLPIGGRVYYSTSVVDLLRIFQDVTEKSRERMPPLSDQTTLHSDIYERLQASIHYVLRHYTENLEELCISGLNEARRERHEELREESKQADPRSILRLLEPLASGSGTFDPEEEEPCVNRQLCVLLSNLHALQDNMQLINKRMLEAVCGENSPLVQKGLGEAPGVDDQGQDFDDALSELSFMSDELDNTLVSGQLSGKLDTLEDDLVERADFQDSRSKSTPPGAEDERTGRARVEPSPSSESKEDLFSQRMRTWQKYCHANLRVVNTSISNCVNCMAETLQAKLLLEVIRLLHAEEMRAQVLDTMVEGGTAVKKRTSAFDLSLGSFRSSPSKKMSMSPDHVAVFLKEVNLDLFMQRLLDVEINLLASHMVPSVFRTVMTSTWCSLVSAMESLVLAVSGWWRPLTAREGRTISQLLDAAISWFHSDGEGLPMDDLRKVASRLMELLDLHSKAVSAIELKYNDLWMQHGGKEAVQRQKDAPPSGWMHNGPDREADAPLLVSSFESRFRKDVSNGVAMIHLIRLLRQRNHDAAAMDLLNKMLKDAAEHPMQVIFGKWGEPMLGQWPCMLARQNEAGSLCVSLNYIGFTTIQPGVAGLLADTSMLLPLAQVTRMERTYERHLQCLSFTMHDKTYHPFSGGQKTFPAREDIYHRVAEAVTGTGSTLDRSLRGEVPTEGPKTLRLPAGEEIFHSLECTRIIGGGLWYNRGVLYACKSFVMFDRPGKERVVIPYGDILSLKMDEVQSWASHPDSRLVLETRSMGRLVFGKCALDSVVACMSSIASRVATVNEYNDK